MRGEHLMVTLDPVGNDGEAGAPRLPVVAAAELSGDDEAEGLDEGVNVRIRDVTLLLDGVETLEVDLESLGLVEEGDGDVKAGQGAQSKGTELSGVGVVTAELLETLLDRGVEVEGSSPDSHCEVFPAVSVGVGTRPLGLDLDGRQVLTLAGQRRGHERSEHNQQLHLCFAVNRLA